ncbi:molecular chaperone DjlA [Kordiimonas sediminis]|uniref:Molecular chaperone DjlA n=1 Tax=Kordiimonas sediminis TaxID=1735581 RepID=A0A919AU27_9PROT|nr:TerB family tellurite resistance protein [Kordiimonas sediminis]GHF22996.1 molecular chaperone DjlA [Kordiimonas sediminis]
MSIWGKIIGGTAGFAIGGPIGALLGVSIGAAVDVGINKATGDPAQTKQITFTIGVIALAAKMAKVDGRVTREEVDAFKQLYRVPAEEMKNVGRVFDMARQSAAGFEAYARQIAGIMADNRAILTDIIDALFYIAESDGHLHPAELDYIRTVGAIFGFSSADIETMIHRRAGPDVNSPYTVLGVEPNISNTALKAHYRALVREHHPDRLMAQGVPSDLIAVATRRAAEINVAYDQIVQQRGMGQ